MAHLPIPNPNPPISFEEMAKGIRLVFENAESFLNEAKALHSSGGHPRCVSLCILAQEEVSKIPQIFQLMYQTDSSGREVSLERFKKDFKSHRRKTVEFMTMYLLDDVLNKDGRHSQKITQAAKSTHPGGWDLSEARERGLYVFFDDETKTFSSPQQVIGEEMARQFLEKLEEHLSLYRASCSAHVSEIAEKLSKASKELNDPSLRKELEEQANVVLNHLKG